MPERITTDRLVLRAFTEADGPRVVSLLNDFAVSKWLARVPYPFTEADLKLASEDGSSRWPGLAAITLKGNVIGAIGSAGHLGYWLGRPFWGEGYASEAAAAMLHQAFTLHDVEAMQSGYFTGNPASGRILCRLGFREVSRDMKLCVARGVTVSNVNVEVSRTDWEAAQ